MEEVWGTTKYIWLTKDRGEAPERGKVKYLPTSNPKANKDLSLILAAPLGSDKG